ncbi:MAG TPA: translation elongation factor Ts [Thermodesulfobacteriota bacterium]|jgi:elongation factor Ts|nr:translation elongation factor Ts [Thermodesulfobacteriota bacterium]
MAEISAQMVKEIRDATGAGFVDCKNALTETDGNAEKAIEILRIKGLAKASKKTGRATPEGTVTSYIHAGGKIGVLLEVNCETDFVARNDEFQEFTREVAMQIAAANPTYVSEEDVPEEVLNKEREIMKAQVIEEGKPEKVADKIVDGKISKYLQENCLVNQIYIRDSKKKISDLLSDLIAKVGENIQIRRFQRYQLGE